MEVAAELRGQGVVGLVYRLIDHSFITLGRLNTGKRPLPL